MADLKNFVMPQSLEMDKSTSTSRYAKFVTEPWESGFGHTIGNALRRVLLTMMEGVAVTCMAIFLFSPAFPSQGGITPIKPADKTLAQTGAQGAFLSFNLYVLSKERLFRCFRNPKFW